MELALNSAAGANALLTRNGNTARIRLRGRRLTRLIALPLLAAGGWALYVAGTSVGHAATGAGAQGATLPGQLILLAIALVCGVPGLMALLARTYVDIDNDLCRITAVRQFGPVRMTRTVPLAGIKQVRTAVDDSREVTIYNVELIGPRPAEPIRVGYSRNRAHSQTFARDLRRALNLPCVDLSRGEADAD
jgi:hypothetical protein